MQTFEMMREAVRQITEEGLVCSEENFPGRLRMFDGSTSQHGPALTFELLWETYGIGDQLEPLELLMWETYGVEDQLETMKISIDLVPVLELEMDSYFHEQLDSILHQDYNHGLRHIKEVHLVHRQQQKGVLQISFALAESRLIQYETETHRKCYKLLKYIYGTREGHHPEFPSYVFKTLFLQHVVQCDKVGSCVLKILCDLKHKLETMGSGPLDIDNIFSTQVIVIEHDVSDGWLTNHRKKLSQLITKLERLRSGWTFLSSFQFSMMKNYIPPEYPTKHSYHPGPFSEWLMLDHAHQYALGPNMFQPWKNSTIPLYKSLYIAAPNAVWPWKRFTTAWINIHLPIYPMPFDSSLRNWKGSEVDGQF